MKEEKLSPKTIMKTINKNTTKNEKIKSKKSITIENLKINTEKTNIKEHKELHTILKTITTCQIADANKNITGKNKVIKGIKPINQEKTYGKIYTAEAPTYDWGTSILAIDNAEKEDILLIKNEGELNAVWGELATNYAQKQNIKGVVIYGAARDIETISKSNFPIFALKTTPNAGKPLGIGQLNKKIYIDNNIIEPGDFLYGDENGVVIVSQKEFIEVITEAYNISINEDKISSQVNNGKLLSEIVGLK